MVRLWTIRIVMILMIAFAIAAGIGLGRSRPPAEDAPAAQQTP